ncbi:hypothetical protein VC83_03785 [Pseudogymnoascus destructans]|uniref:Ribosomal protein/NADH dehydrogenase domain-containing protein n=1 Tax=Pseudogymnoascus destructans TaxID=655981 RepID=A0A177AC92_9PEZI|nr:uncharacterized protein VC83_03785 [Pseudogymnoascus destructans]OAF59729.1 hypothetical protein VC83_03785 [Pseudogymnoascus destructans]
MVSILRRMTKLRALLAIKLGPGAAVLPKNVTKLHMEFAKRMNDGHYGPRKFWHSCLPRLKYHNPTVSMTLERTTNQEGPALMTVYFDDATHPQTPSAPVAGTQTEPPASSQQRVVTINMKHRHESEILSQLLALTNAVPVEPTPEEVEQLQKLAALKEVGERDSARHRIFNAEKKREEAILAQARSAA